MKKILPFLAAILIAQPVSANPASRILQGMKASGCKNTLRQAEVVLTTMRMNQINFILYIGPRNTIEGFQTVLNRALRTFRRVGIVECESNPFEGFTILYIAPDARYLGHIQADGENWAGIGMFVVER